jgi:hypothetical protein
MNQTGVASAAARLAAARNRARPVIAALGAETGDNGSLKLATAAPLGTATSMSSISSAVALRQVKMGTSLAV